MVFECLQEALSLALTDSAKHTFIQPVCVEQHVRIVLEVINRKLRLQHFIHSFIHLLDTFALGTFYIAGTILDIEGRAVNITVSTHMEPAF